MKKAIISAAGWKGAGSSIGLGERPEPFLPLGDGTTSLSRNAHVLSENGYEVYIAIGKRGYPYSKYVRWTANNYESWPDFDSTFPWDGSPWTQELYDYASKLGTVLEVHNPGGWSTSVDTFCEAMDMLGEKNWKHLFLTCGDMIVPRPCFEYILEQEIPFIFSFTAYHVCFGMDLDRARIFREYSEPYRRFKSEDAWLHDKALSPGYQGVDVLKKSGFQHVQMEGAPPCKWVDIDTEKTYKRARRLVKEMAWAI